MRLYIILVCISCLLLIFACRPKDVVDIEKEKTECTSLGGNWSSMLTDANPTGRCVITYKDGGTPCTSSDQCEGDCVTNVTLNLGKSGWCSKENSKYERCLTPIEENRITCRADDILYVPKENTTSS
jgi:hypothetical protein